MTAVQNAEAVAAGRPAAQAEPQQDKWDPRSVQEKWLAAWDKLDLFEASDDAGDPRPRTYVLDMFPYPSGDLHMGHAEAYAVADAMARYYFQRGHNVLHPIGWDAFGLPAENAAIRGNSHPADWTYKNIETQAASFRRYALSFDWTRRLHTCDPEYYRWTQWLFLRLYERGLAYRGDGYVNWCPRDQTVLANEQVVDGHCERCGAEVVRRTLTQWYFKITEYADRLLADMEPLEDSWPDRVLLMQRNWIGRSEGAEVQFAIEGSEQPVTVFTTRPDTLFGATFFVVAADSPLAEELCLEEHRGDLAAYLSDVRKLTDIERQSADRPKTGVFLGRHAINPVNGERIPVWAADYVLPDYGTGAIMAVPAHDQRDLDFAREFGLPVRVVVQTDLPDPAQTGQATPGDGTLVNSGPLDGMNKAEAIAAITEILAGQGLGRAAVSYRLRDWLVSRQRFWGAPIPIVYCEVVRRGPGAGRPAARAAARPARPGPGPEGHVSAGGRGRLGEHPVPEVLGPGPPGHRHDGHVRRLVLVLPAVLLARVHRRPVRGRLGAPVVPDRPVRGRRRARDPAPAVQPVLHQGAVRHGHGRLHRAVQQADQPGPGDQPGQGDVEVAGQRRRPGRAAGRARRGRDPADDAVRQPARGRHRLGRRPAGGVGEVPGPGRADRLRRRRRGPPGRADGPIAAEAAAGGDVALRRVTHKTIEEATRLVEAARLNVAVARLMELATATRRAIDSGPGPADPAVREAAETLAVLLSLFAPFTAEESWAMLGHAPSVAKAGWPAADPALLVEDQVTCVVQVNGKVRDRLEVPPGISEEELRELALAAPGIVRALDGRDIRKVIVRAPKLVNIVPAS